MDVREKLGVIAHLGDHISYREGIGICYDSALAKVIEDAYMELKNGVTVQEWISVKDRLPEHGDVVMVWHTYMEYPFVCQWDERSDCWIDDKWTFGRNAITHWCRLPQPPKGE